MGKRLLFKSITKKHPNYKGNYQNLTGNLMSNSRLHLVPCEVGTVDMTCLLVEDQRNIFISKSKYC